MTTLSFIKYVKGTIKKLYQIFGDGWVIPEAGVVKCSVAVLIHEVDVRFVFKQLKLQTSIKTLFIFILIFEYNVL